MLEFSVTTISTAVHLIHLAPKFYSMKPLIILQKLGTTLLVHFPTTEHHFCNKFYIPSTSGVRYILNLDWFMKQIPFTKVSTEDYLYQTESDTPTILSEK